MIEPSGRYQTFSAALDSTNQTTVYTVPAEHSAIGWEMTLVKVDASAPTVTATVDFVDDSAATTRRLLYQYPVPTVPYSLNLMRIAMEEGDTLKVTAGAANDLEVIGSVLLIPHPNG